MNKNLLRHCIGRSLRGLSSHNQYKHYIHYSFAVVDGSVYVVGTNKSAVPSVHLGYNQRVPEPKIHSELDAYKKLRKIVPIGKVQWSLINVRLNRSGEMKNSRPCHVCQEWLSQVGCTEVYYTTEAGWSNMKMSNT